MSSNARSSRRQTFCPSVSSLHEGTTNDGGDAAKDRRALLEEWRAGLRNKNNPSPSIAKSSPVASQMGVSPKKRTRDVSEDQENVPNHSNPPPAIPRPPSSSAMDRYRLRRQEQYGVSAASPMKDSNTSSGLPRQPQSSVRFTPSNTDSDFTVGSAATPSSRLPSSSLSRRLSVASGSAKKARRKTLSSKEMRSMSAQTPTKASRLPLNAESARGNSSHDGRSATPSSQHEDEQINTVEGAGLRSRVEEMQQQIARLEREKLQLSLAKAPLEERLKQKEESWAKEQSNLKQQIDGLRVAAQEGENHRRSLKHANSELEVEKKKLLLDLHKCSVNESRQNDAGSGGTSSTFQRQLQNDRDVQDLRQKLHSADEEIKGLKLDKLSLESEVSASSMELDTLITEFEQLETEYKELEVSSSQSNDAEIKLAVLEREHIATSAQLNAVCSDLAAIKSSSESAMEEVQKQWKSEVIQLKFALNVLKARKGSKEDDEDSADINSSDEDEAVLRARIEERDAKIIELEAQLLKGTQLRRQMHNRIQELRGNIRVFVRTRPFLPGDGTATESAISVLRDGETLRLNDKAKKPHEFKFDKVFAPSSGQDGVFDEVSEFVQSALDGYHVVLFCYGMTGSGKTHTMQGSGNGAMRGIIPRAVEQVLSQAKLMQSQKWQFTMTASFLEIYNEELKDLLTSMNKGSTADKVVTRQTSKHGQKLAIKRDANGKSFVDGLCKISIETDDTEKGMNQLEALMAVAARSRSVASTAMNSQSSRSHSVFMLHLRGYNAESDTVVEGALNLCDLAGSERLDRSGAASDRARLKETLSINKSLSSLGDVFTSLANKSKHVPYRNSKLTYLLQDCLSGDGKALMFVNLSPTEQSSNESLCSLRFAQRVNQIELGKPTKHVQYGDN